MSSNPLPDQSDRQHSSVCIDNREFDGEGCTCRPPENAPAPDTFELWWCTYCGEPSVEWSDPCQRCGEPIVRRTYVALDETGLSTEENQ